MYALDFGEGAKLKVRWNGVEQPTPKPPRGLCKRGCDKFIWILQELLSQDDVVVESAAIGSSGVEAEMVRDVVEVAPYNLYVISGRAVKNYIRSNKVKDAVTEKSMGRDKVVYLTDDDQAALIIGKIAYDNPASLKEWKYVDPSEKLHRIHSSVRPYDKRSYKGPEVEAFLSLLPPPEELPETLSIFVKGKRKIQYVRPQVMPFAMALTEPGAETRNGYEQIIGLYAHGFPSFYRRATVTLMQKNAKELAGVTKMQQVSDEQRKEAWKITRKQIRMLYNLSNK